MGFDYPQEDGRGGRMGWRGTSHSMAMETHCSKSSFFVQKFNFDFLRKLLIFLGWKTRENVGVLDFLAVDNFDFTRKIVKKNLGEKLVKMLGFCQNWIFGQKFDFSNSVWKMKKSF